jgi:hypothetical protein
MKQSLTRRLERLERAVPSARDEPQLGPPFSVALFQAALLAVHRGGYQEGQPITAAHARALGFNDQEYRRTMADQTWLDRHQLAWADLCREQGYRAGKEVAFLQRMVESLPTHVRRALQLEHATDAYL